ncbi:hypothetical protein [Allostreptomyces psammosilenae]|uniref:Uncharacterized protein n=1 Tax=Allostreptomyces psammosilenae TaxID=1892865 RepID=A0A852ZYS2_9ACTN|nr:hypothetical protein [Allostreptomyces psammosilenae]NYI03432.1 hypothetical protein [Allostreptomyces psammosilenae]
MASMTCSIRRSADIGALLTELHDDAQDDFEPFLLTAWMPALSALIGDGHITLAALADVLDEPMMRRAGRTGQRPSRPAWHCRITTTALDGWDEQAWEPLARMVVDVAGIAPVDDPAACRWIALRTAPEALDIVASVIREDGRWARIHNDLDRVRACLLQYSPARHATTTP